jgi:hypothetical protein
VGRPMAEYDVETAKRLLDASSTGNDTKARLAAAALLDALAEALGPEWVVERASFLGSRSVEIYARKRVIVFHDDNGNIGITTGLERVHCPAVKNLAYDARNDCIASPDGKDALVVLSTSLVPVLGQ